jgi:hypothetical protein
MTPRTRNQLPAARIGETAREAGHYHRALSKDKG